jgi:hypothetical protein
MKNLNESISLWFGIILVLMVIAGAVAFIFTDFMADTLYGGRRTFMIIVFISYAIFRGVRIYQGIKASDYEK